MKMKLKIYSSSVVKVTSCMMSVYIPFSHANSHLNAAPESIYNAQQAFHAGSKIHRLTVMMIHYVPFLLTPST